MRILFITGGSPWPANIGVNQRTSLIYKALSENGRVDLVINSQYVEFNESEKLLLAQKYNLIYILNPLSEKLKTKEILFQKKSLSYMFERKREDWFGHYIINKKSEDLIKELIFKNSYNVVVTRYLRSAINTGAFKYGPCILDVDDLNMDIVKDRYLEKKENKIKKMVWPIYSTFIRIIEKNYLQKIDFLWFTKEGDRIKLSKNNSSVLPNIPYIEKDNSFMMKGTENEQEESHTILFVGSMYHNVNLKGIDRFIQNVWAKIKIKNLYATLRIVGTGMTISQKERWNQYDGVKAIGYVDNIETEYRKCAFSIIPLYEGGGTKIKLIESLRYGKTCVVTEHSMKGYEKILRDGEEVLIAENDDALAHKCLELLNNSQKRIQMGKIGQKKVSENLTYRSFSKIVEQGLAQVACDRKVVSLRY